MKQQTTDKCTACKGTGYILIKNAHIPCQHCNAMTTWRSQKEETQ